MKCEDFRDNIVDLIDHGDNSTIKEHISQCKDCERFYKETLSIINSIDTKVDIKADKSIKENIMNACRQKTNKRKTWSLGTSIAASLIASLLVTFTIVKTNNANAADKLLDKSTEAAIHINNMVMKLNVRTLPDDSFALIDISADMVPHTISVITENTRYWRLEKSGRVNILDGEKQYMWTDKGNAAYFGDKSSDFAEWFKIFLDPQMLFITEKATTKDKNTKYQIDSNDSEIALTITSKAKGNFKNNYLLNSSIEESDNRREYIFNKATNLLKSLKIYILMENDTEVLVLETTDIKYNTYISKEMLTQKPERSDWKDINSIDDLAYTEDKSTTPNEVAEYAFKALCSGNVDKCVLFYSFNNEAKSALNKTYNGAKLIRLGNPFQSGEYKGYFIPFEILMPTGKVLKHNLAIRNDNKNKVWQIDGGI